MAKLNTFYSGVLGAVAPEQPLVPTGVKSPSVSLEEERPLKQQIDGSSSSVFVLPVDQRPYRFQPCLQHTCWRLLTAAKYAGCGVGGGGETLQALAKISHGCVTIRG